MNPRVQAGMSGPWKVNDLNLSMSCEYRYYGWDPDLTSENCAIENETLAGKTRPET